MEFHKIRRLIILDDYIILALFKNGEWRKYDLKPLMDKYPAFKQLEDQELYKKAKIDLGGFGIVWNENVDLSAEGIYLDGENIGEEANDDFKKETAAILLDLRKKSGLSQNDLARLSGVSQSTIARIEKGTMDPSLSTIEKIFSPLGIKLSFSSVSR